MTVAVVILSIMVFWLAAIILALVRSHSRERRHLVNVAFSRTSSDLIALDHADNPTPKPRDDAYERAVNLNNPLGIG